MLQFEFANQLKKYQVHQNKAVFVVVISFIEIRRASFYFCNIHDKSKLPRYWLHHQAIIKALSLKFRHLSVGKTSWVFQEIFLSLFFLAPPPPPPKRKTNKQKKGNKKENYEKINASYTSVTQTGASSAIVALDGARVGDRQISVALSNPPSRKPRQPGAEQQQRPKEQPPGR